MYAGARIQVPALLATQAFLHMRLLACIMLPSSCTIMLWQQASIACGPSVHVTTTTNMHTVVIQLTQSYMHCKVLLHDIFDYI